MITVILMASENSANIGSIARAMANFNFSKLILINPKVDHLNDEALSLAKHAKKILRNAKVKPYSYFKRMSNDFDYVIATTSVLGTDYNLKRLPISPKEMANKLQRNMNIGLLFGRDGSGLRNSEIEKCDFVVTIPTSNEYPAMNISHAAAIIFHELFNAFGSNKVNGHIAMATSRERKVIMNKIYNIINNLSFATPQKKTTQKLVWKNLIEKSFITRREAYGAMGLLRKVEEKVKKRNKN